MKRLAMSAALAMIASTGGTAAYAGQMMHKPAPVTGFTAGGPIYVDCGQINLPNCVPAAGAPAPAYVTSTAAPAVRVTRDVVVSERRGRPYIVDDCATTECAPQPRRVHKAGGGWSAPRVFVGGSVGLSFGGDFNRELKLVKGHPTGSQAGTRSDSVEIGYNVGAEAGLAFNGGWCAKVEYRYITNNSGNPKNDYDATLQTGFLTVEKEFLPYAKIRPYLGLGVGFVDLEYVDNVDFDTQAGYKLGAGVATALTDSVDAYVEYNYIGSFSDFEGTATDPAGNKYSITGEYDPHLLNAGVRWSLN